MEKFVLFIVVLSFLLSCEVPELNKASKSRPEPVVESINDLVEKHKLTVLTNKLIKDFRYLEDGRIIYLIGDKIEEIDGKVSKLIYKNEDDIFSFSMKKNILVFNSNYGETSIVFNGIRQVKVRLSYGYIPSPIIKEKLIVLGENYVRYLSFDGKETKKLKLPQRMTKILERQNGELIISLADRQSLVTVRNGIVEKIGIKIKGLVANLSLKDDMLLISTSLGKVYMFDLAKRKVKKVIETDLGDIASAALHPHKHLIAVFSMEGRLLLIDHKTGF
jgi:hypothetical protein